MSKELSINLTFLLPGQDQQLLLILSDQNQSLFSLFKTHNLLDHFVGICEIEAHRIAMASPTTQTEYIL